MAIESGAVAVGLATIADDGRVLDTWYPAPQLTTTAGKSGTRELDAREFAAATGREAGPLLKADPERKVKVIAVRTAIESLAAAPIDAHDVYLRLHLLSHRLIRPHGANLDGQFGLLANVAWTSLGPCLPEQVDELRWTARLRGHALEVHSVDKFPRMTDYVVPAGVRIADAERVRLGAHLAAGTTVMHEGFCNFNAGTLGNSMVEGRISAGVVVGEGSDIGGGASIMGTLSGGGKQVVSVGQRCLLGANSGIGIPLADDCVVEAGCYITAGTRVTLPSGEVVKAIELSTRPQTLFRRNSVTGRVEAVPRTGDWGGLNAQLHTTA